MFKIDKTIEYSLMLYVGDGLDHPGEIIHYSSLIIHYSLKNQKCSKLMNNEE